MPGRATIGSMPKTPNVPPSANILDVARAAGVSRTTVSRAMNEPGSLSSETLERVRSAAAALNYVPRTAARSLRSGRTNTVALLVGDISQPFHGGLAKAVTHAAEDRNMSVLLCDLDHSEDRLVGFLERLPLQGTDGIIIATADDLTAPAVRNAMSRASDGGTPVVITTAEPVLENVTSLAVDYARIAYDATANLLADGRRNIILVGGLQSTYIGRELMTGYTRALKESGARGEEVTSRIFKSLYSYEGALELVFEYLAGGEPLDGIVVATVPMGLGVIRAVEDAGLSIPGDVAVIACEDIPLANQTRPALSTVGVDAQLSGYELVEVLYGAITGTETRPSALPIRATVRDTSR